AVVPPPAHQAPQDVDVLDIGQAGDDHATGTQERRRPAQNGPGIDEVFQHIGGDDGVERNRLEGPIGVFEIHHLDAGQSAARDLGDLGGQLDAGDLVAAPGQQLPELAVSTPQFEDAAAGYGDQSGDLGSGLVVVAGGAPAELNGGGGSQGLHDRRTSRHT